MKLFDEFVFEEELFPFIQVVCCVFVCLGEKENCVCAWVKFLVSKLGVEEFCCIVLEERVFIFEDECWIVFLSDFSCGEEKFLKEGCELLFGDYGQDFEVWCKINIYV